MIADTLHRNDRPAMPDSKKSLLDRRGAFVKAVIAGYTQVFFSNRWLAGLFFLAATFVIPKQGAAGMTGIVVSNLWARLLGLPKKYIEQGVFAFNGLLIGLAMGLFYRIDVTFFILLIIAALLGVVVAVACSYFYERYLFIPVLSLPFVLTTWIVMAAVRQYHGMSMAVIPRRTDVLTDLFPPAIDLFIHSLGATFFQLSLPAGILIACGLLIYSRFAFVLATVGYASGSMVYILLGGNPENLRSGLMGFNFVLTAIAVGGVWSVIGIDSIILVVAASGICGVIAPAVEILLEPLGLPALAFPFVMTTGLMIYACRHRGVVSRIKPVLSPQETPEKNLKHYLNTRARFLTGEIPVFDLPISGEWRVMQGFSGDTTHRGLWRHAWDFEVFDDPGENHKDSGLLLEDFYSFNMPVFAPTEGTVVTVVNHHADNPVGQVNTEHNWGNTIVIWHYGTVYTALCHLKKGSISVNEGDIVRRGQLLGKVGNSGRSPFPHLHFQVQTSHEIGAPTVASELMHYVSERDRKFIYRTHGCPMAGDRIRPMQADSRVYQAVSFPIGRNWTFWIRCPDREWEEHWETEVDFAGNRFLLCREQKARIKLFVNRKVFLLLEYEGPRHTGLFWFFTAVARIPMTSENVTWQETLPGELPLAIPARVLFDLVQPIFPLATLSTDSKIFQTGERVDVTTVMHARGKLAPQQYRDARMQVRFEINRGLLSLSVQSDGRYLFELFNRA